MVGIQTLKQKIQTNTHTYIVGIKYVDTECVSEVLTSFKADEKIYGENLARYVIYKDKGIIKIGLKSNATPAVYVFKEKVKFDLVIAELKKGEIPITIV